MADRKVTVKLVIDDKGSVKVVQGVGRESERTEGKLKKLDKQVHGLGKSFGGLKNVLLGGLGVGSIAFGLESVISKTKEIAQETESFTSKTGIGAKSSLYYAQALKARGLSGETVTKAFGFLAKNIKSAELQENAYAKSQTKAAAKGQLTTSVLGRQAQAFKELGINLSTFNDLTEQQKLETITQKFEGLTDGTKKLRLEREIFGRGGNQLSTVLDKNNLGLSHQIELAKKFFPEIKGGANAMNELIARQSESKMAWEGLEFTLGTKLAPALSKAMGFFSEVIAEANRGKGPLADIEHTFEGIAHFAGGALGFVKNIASAFGVKLPAGTLGAVLAAAGIHSIKHPVKVSKTAINTGKGAASVGKKLLPLALANPELAAPTIGFALGAGLGVPLNKAFPEGLFPTGFAGAPRGNLNVKGPYSYGPSGGTRGEVARGGGETPREAQIIAKAIESLKPTHDQREIHLRVGAVEVATAVIHDPRARREIAEAVALYSQQMTARK